MELQKIQPITIVIDFDGTCVTHEFPKIGKDIGAIPVLKELIKKGHNLILFTMRSDIEKPKSDNPLITAKGGMYLTDAVKWFEKNDIKLYGIQTNPTQKNWTHSPKAYGELIIDDAALGCPLVANKEYSDKPYADWISIRLWLVNNGIL